MGLCGYLIGVHLWTWIFMFSVMAGGRADFRQLYTAGYMVRIGRGAELYDYNSQTRFQNAVVSEANVTLPFNHLAYESLLFAPLSLLPYKGAYLAFLAVNVFLLGLCFGLLRSHLDNVAIVFSWLPAALFLGFLPIAAALIQGQDSVLLLTLLIGCFLALEADRQAAAGALCGLGLFKFQIVIPIALLFLLWKRRRFVVGFALSAFAVGCVSSALVGANGLRSYFHDLLRMSADLSSKADEARYAISPASMANLRGLVYGAIGSGRMAFWITLVASLAVLVFAARYRGPDRFVVAVATSSLISYHLLIHDMTVLALPIFLVIDGTITSEADANAEDRRLFRCAVPAFLSPLLISYAPGHYYLAALPVIAFTYVLIRLPRCSRLN